MSLRISFERSGGFAGFLLTARIDTASLPVDEARQVEEMIREAGFFDLSSPVPSPIHGADRFQYEVTVEARDRRHTVRATEGSVPADLQPLLDYLTKAAKGIAS